MSQAAPFVNFTGFAPDGEPVNLAFKSVPEGALSILCAMLSNPSLDVTMMTESYAKRLVKSAKLMAEEL